MFFSSSRVLPVVLVCSSLTLAGRSASAETKTYPIPQNPAIQLTYPPGWQSRIDALPGQSPTITVIPGPGADVLVKITAHWSVQRDPKFSSDEQVKAMAENLKGFLAPTAVEKNIALDELKGPIAHGYYCTVKDKAARRGEHEYMTSVAVGVGTVIISGTILSHNKDSNEFKAAMAIFENASQKGAAKNK